MSALNKTNKPRPAIVLGFWLKMVKRWMFNSAYWNYHRKIIFSYWKRGILTTKCMVMHKTESQSTRPPKRENRFKSNFQIYFIQKTISNKNKAKQHALLLKWYTSLNSACKCTIRETLSRKVSHNPEKISGGSRIAVEFFRSGIVLMSIHTNPIFL